MRLATWIYRLLWVAVLGYMIYFLSPWEAAGAIALVGALVFMKTVTTYGEVIPQVNHLRSLAEQVVVAARDETKAMRDKLERHGLS